MNKMLQQSSLSPSTTRYIQGAIILLCLIAFYPVFKAGFVNYDDPEYIINNGYIKKFSFSNIQAIFAGKATTLYVPLTVFSYLIEYSLFGENAKIFHTVNLLLHIANALLLFALLCRLKIKDLYLSGFILLFFTLSPLVTESVCWITERKDVLYTLFLFLSALQFLNYQETGALKHLGFCFLLFLLSCFSKPMAVSLPFLLLLYQVYNDRKVDLKKNLLLLPFFIASAIFSVISLISIRPDVDGRSVVFKYNLGQKIFLFFSETGYYFFKPFMPIRQQLTHILPKGDQLFQNNVLVFYAVAGFALFITIIYLVLKKKQWLPGLLFLSWLLFLLPVLQFYPNTHSYVSERYFYISILFPVALAYLLIRHLGAKEQQLKTALLLLVPVFLVLTIQRSSVWKTSQGLFAEELKRDENNPYALNNLGYHYNSIGDYAMALPLLRKALHADSLNPHHLINYGWSLQELGQTDSAMVYFNRAIAQDNKFIEAYKNLGICYVQKKDSLKALNCFEKAYALNHENHESNYILGTYYLELGQPEKARPLIRRAYELGNKQAAKFLNY